ncbi:MAG: DUF108 domain-containing protein [bacterium]|nr:DUF108 domain-containing protein [bacterium]
MFGADIDQARVDALGLTLRDCLDPAPLGVDLVIEAAGPEALKRVAPRVLSEANLLPFSLTASADVEFNKTALEVARASAAIIYLPHGAIAGLDGLHDARSIITEVRVSTSKPPRSLGRDDRRRQVLFEGITREACRRFPRNVNVHAAVALAGLGFDRTVSVLVSDPASDVLEHIIEAKGPGVEFSFRIASRPQAGVTGVYTPESAYQTAKRLCVRRGGGMVPV